MTHPGRTAFKLFRRPAISHMANFVLGPGAARRFKELMRGRMASGRVDGDAAHVVDEREYEHPYKLTYAASAGAVDEESGAPVGAWLIWLPFGSLTFNGTNVSPEAALQAANGYPAGWYDLTGIFDGEDVPDSWPLILVVYSDSTTYRAKFVVDDSDIASTLPAGSHVEGTVRIASIVGKTVLQIVRSVLRLVVPNRQKMLQIGLLSGGVQESVPFLVRYPGLAIDALTETVAVPGFAAGTGVSIVLQNGHYVISATGGGGGGSEHGGDNADVSVGGSGGIFSWTAATRTIGVGGVLVGRKWYSVTSETGANKQDGYYSLKVTVNGSSVSGEVVNNVSFGVSPTDTECWIPIYRIQDGKIAADYRGAFVVPVYE